MSAITTFTGGRHGRWRIVRNEVVAGEPLAPAERLEVAVGRASGSPEDSVWLLRGIPSYERYVNRRERAELEASSPPLGRPEATHAALIPISKSPVWWNLPQDERREIFEERSHHIATGLKYLPAVARRLYHGRDLGEPFDFLTWFEFSPADASAFEELVIMLARPASGSTSSGKWTSGWFETLPRTPGAPCLAQFPRRKGASPLEVAGKARDEVMKTNGAAILQLNTFEDSSVVQDRNSLAS